MRRENQVKYLGRICALLSISIAIVSASILLFSTQYAFFVYDDFSLGKIGEVQSDLFENITTSIKTAQNAWFTWTGDVSTLFLQVLLAPIKNGGLERLHIVLAIEMFFLFVSMALFLFVLLRSQIEGNWTWLILGMILSVFLNGRSYSQVFHYFVASSYEVSLCFLCFALSFFLLYHNKRRIIFFVMTVVFALLAMTGSLLEDGAGCMFVFILLLDYYKKKELSRYDVVLFLIFFFAAIFSVFAPGNFVRRGIVENEISVIKAVFFSLRAYVIQLEWMLKDTAYVLLFLASVLCGLFLGRKRQESHVDLFLLLMAVFVPIAAIFPTVYGTGSPYLPDRVLLNIDFFLIVGWTLFAISCGKAVSGLFANEISMMAVGIGLLFVLSICVMPYRIEDAETYVIAKSTINGELKRYYDEVNSLIQTIQDSEEEDVVIYSLPEPAEGILVFDISEDPHYFANEEIAGYFRKNTVRLMENDR